ncbi:MAG TPA: hypothetical protein VNJ70_05500 [Thermoanaerobaculia bacterium]|nr:hypothetical protein [Thermoanaerobaculia bacterium]
MIVETKLDATKLHTFSQIPWGSVWLSSYHVTVNRDARQHDVDAYLTEPVSADHVVSIRTAVPSNGEWAVGDNVDIAPASAEVLALAVASFADIPTSDRLLTRKLKEK